MTFKIFRLVSQHKPLSKTPINRMSLKLVVISVVCHRTLFPKYQLYHVHVSALDSGNTLVSYAVTPMLCFLFLLKAHDHYIS